jgi:hypothetical protein
VEHKIIIALIIFAAIIFAFQYNLRQDIPQTPTVFQTPKTCTAFDVESNRWIRTNVYFGSVRDKMRLDVELKNLRNDTTEKRYVITNARMVYMWNDKSNKGIKFNIKGQDAPKEMLVPQLQKNCRTWKQETYTIFEPPANIIFKLANKDEVSFYVTKFNRF